MFSAGSDGYQQIALRPIFSTLQKLLKKEPSFRMAGLPTSAYMMSHDIHI